MRVLAMFINLGLGGIVKRDKSVRMLAAITTSHLHHDRPAGLQAESGLIDNIK